MTKRLLSLFSLCVTLSALPLGSFAQENSASRPQDWVAKEWESHIPRIIHPDKQLEELYINTWDIAAGRVRKGPEGMIATPYLDENCYEDQIWIWDACFMVMFSKYAPEAYPGKETLENLYQPIHENVTPALRIHLRDNPPIFAWVEHDNYTFTADSAQINHVLLEKQYLQRHYHYFDTVSIGNIDQRISPNPIFRDRVLDNQGELIGFAWHGGASGMDNTPRGREQGGYQQIMWVDAIAQQALSALYISRLYESQGMKKQAKEWMKKYNHSKDIINQYYWNQTDGFYYDVSIKDKSHSNIKTPSSFWVMMAEIPTPQQAERMSEYLKSEKYMGGDSPWVSLSRDDKDFNGETGDYWRGGIWLPHAYMGIKALEKYGMYSLADKTAKDVVYKQLRTYHKVAPHTIWECYSPDRDEPSTEHGRRARPDFCGWSALGPISLTIENILGFRKVNAVEKQVEWWLKKENGRHGITNLRFGEVKTDLIYDDKTLNIEASTNTPYTLIIHLEDGSKRKFKITPSTKTISL